MRKVLSGYPARSYLNLLCDKTYRIIWRVLYKKMSLIHIHCHIHPSIPSLHVFLISPSVASTSVSDQYLTPVFECNHTMVS